MPRTSFHSDDAPKAIGPYSQAVAADPFVYLSGQTPIDPATGALVDGGITEQTEQVFRNITAVLTAAGLTRDDVVKCNVYLTDLKGEFAAMNAVYAAQFDAPFPARTTVEVRGLPLGCKVEIEVIARR